MTNTNDSTHKATAPTLWQKIKKAVGGAVVAGAMTGCTALGSNRAADWDPQYETRVNQVAQYELGERVSDDKILKIIEEQYRNQNLLGSKANISEIRKIESTPPAVDALQETVNQLDPKKDDQFEVAYAAMLAQNQALSDLFKSANVQRYILHRADDNIDFGFLIGNWTDEDQISNSDATRRLTKSLEALTYEKRQLLDSKLTENTDYQTLKNWNVSNLKAVRGLATMLADLETMEGHIGRSYSSSKFAADIATSLSGKDQLKIGQDNLKALLEKSAVEVYQDKGHPFRAEVNQPDRKLNTVYEEFLSQIKNEAAGADYETRHDLNMKAFYILSMAEQAQRNGLLGNGDIGIQNLIATNLAIHKDIKEAVQKGLATRYEMSDWEKVDIDSTLQKEEWCQWYGEDGLLQVINPLGIVQAATNWYNAWTDDHWQPSSTNPYVALNEGVIEGRSRRFGYQSADHFLATTSPAIGRTIGGVISPLVWFGPAGLFKQITDSDAAAQPSTNGGGGLGPGGNQIGN